MAKIQYGVKPDIFKYADTCSGNDGTTTERDCVRHQGEPNVPLYFPLKTGCNVPKCMYPQRTKQCAEYGDNHEEEKKQREVQEHQQNQHCPCHCNCPSGPNRPWCKASQACRRTKETQSSEERHQENQKHATAVVDDVRGHHEERRNEEGDASSSSSSSSC